MASGRGRARDERGLSESVQWAVLAPLLLFVVLGIIQTGLVLRGRTVAVNAALAGAEAQALAGQQPGVGELTAREVAEGGGLRQVHIEVETSQPWVRVRVSGQPESFLPALWGGVSASAEQPLEVPR